MGGLELGGWYLVASHISSAGGGGAGGRVELPPSRVRESALVLRHHRPAVLLCTRSLLGHSHQVSSALRARPQAASGTIASGSLARGGFDGL